VTARDAILEFDAESHTYRVGDRLLPSVTQIIAPLYSWLNIPADILERKGRLGTAVHMATEYHDKGTLNEASVSDEVNGYLEAWRKFRRETGFFPATIERKVHNVERGYAGTLDRAGVFPNEPEAISVIDIKSGAEHDAHGVQIAGYALAFVAERGLRTYPARRAVYLKADGTYHQRRFIEPSDYPTFLGLVSVAQWRAKHEH
jgi:hypothetical protein